MRKNSILFFSVLFLAQLLIVQAQDETSLMKGSETAAHQQEADGGKCVVFSRYVVKTASGEGVGEDIEIYRRVQSIGAEEACQTGSAPYFAIKNADANYFAGLSGDFLFIDNGTGTDGRGLEIFNLRLKKSVYSTEYYDELELQQGKFVLYDKLSPTKGVLKNCRQAAEWKRNGLGIGWVRQAKLDLQTLKEVPVGTIRCRAFQ